MHEIQRLPAILCKSSEPFDMRNYYIPDYEILTSESLHDMCNHTKNLYDELPWHLPKNEKAKLNDIITTSFHSKEAKNSSHYWKRLLIVTNWLIQNLPELYMAKIFSTFAEIPGITYAIREKRSCPKILRLSNITFTHALLLLIHIKDNLKSLTSRKLFGVYYLSIVRYAPIQFHLFSSRTVNTEFFTMFTAMRRDTNNSSKLHPGNIMKNIIQVQVRSKLWHTSRNGNQSYLYNLYSPIKLQLQNSPVSYHWIKRYPFEFQCLLERQADFLLEEHFGGPPEMMVLFSRTSLISLPTVFFHCIIFDLGQ